ncbi:MAG: VanW family protein [Patescibacteria group bacterium]
MKNIFSKKRLKKILKLKKLVWVAALFLLTLLILFLAYNLYFFAKIYPHTLAAGIDLSGLSPQEAAKKLKSQVDPPGTIVLVSGQNVTFEIPTEDIALTYDFAQTAKVASELVRTGNALYDFYQRAKAIFVPTNIGLRFTFDQEALNESLTTIAGDVEVKPVFPLAKLVKNEIVVDKGKAGIELDTKTLRANIGRSLAYAQQEPITLPLSQVDPTLSDQETEIFKQRLTGLKEKSLVLKFELATFVYKGDGLFALINPKDEYDQEAIKNLVATVAKAVNREAQDSVFVFEAGRVKEFAPAKDGIALKADTLREMLVGNLRTLEQGEESAISLEIPVERRAPKVKTEDVNNLGIRQLIGRGSSRFAGSIANRVYNISLAASKFRGVLIPPGGTFSFNDILGDVSVFTGYKQAYIIKDGKTILGDGGGVCQVSTTLFRAALAAALPIVERRAHSYRVSYYEQDSPAGLDATVYAPSTDLKIKNDTPGHILIQPVVDTKKSTLAFEIYGTSDGRTSSVSKPVVTNVTPPPEDLYIDDPTLPLGKVKQIDFKAWGAKVTYTYKVVRGAETIYQKTFVSNYRPWQAVYLRGAGPAE